MQIVSKASLREYNTFGIDCTADSIVLITADEDLERLPELLADKARLVVGSGSNLLFTDDFRGQAIHMNTRNIKVENDFGNDILIYADAGVNWDLFVGWCVEKGYGGVENLSLIPGCVGAVPVQNIGAYGIEAGYVIEKVAALDLETGEKKLFTKTACNFGYRSSIFKTEMKGKYLITGVWFRLSKKPTLNTGYGSLNEEVIRRGPPTIRTVREAVIHIRQSKLPDPQLIGNAGSFFKNPVIQAGMAEELRNRYPDSPLYDAPGGLKKIAAGWLIEKCGWRGKRFGDAGVHDKQALVLVNYGRATGQEILRLSEAIRKSVFDNFGILLEREVEVIGPEF